MAHFFYVLVKKRKAASFAKGDIATVKIGDTTCDDPDLKSRIYPINATSRNLSINKPADPRSTKSGWELYRLIRTTTRQSAAALALSVQARAAARGKLYFVRQSNSSGLRCTDYVTGVSEAELDAWIRAEKSKLKRLKTETIQDEPVCTA